MMRKCLLLCLLVLLAGSLLAQPAVYEWRSPSRNSSESMPCGGGDVGMNVWVEQGDVLFYLSRSGCFDENNTLLKLGRFRIRLSQPLQLATFRQQLVLNDGYCRVTDGETSVLLWVDTGKPVVHIEVESRKQRQQVEVSYESWRTRDQLLTKRERFQTSYKFAAPQGLTTRRDSIMAREDGLWFCHHNADETIFDATVRQQQMEAVKPRLYNPLRQLTFGGHLQGRGFTLKGRTHGHYASHDFDGWTYQSAKPARQHHLTITMATRQGTIAQWQQDVTDTERHIDSRQDKQRTRQWWHQFWQRSYVEVPSPNAQHPTPIATPHSQRENAPHHQLLVNYTLFRYMMGCNSRGAWPTKFNGGLFTFDPEYVYAARDGRAGTEEYRLSPDFRNWGGGVHTAQNQRLLYWPLLKSGDYDLLLPQLEFYRRICPNAEERSRLYWGHEGACLTEQIENYGLPCYPEYGTKRPAGFDPGMERNAWLEYEWDTCLEFCQMALEAHRYGGIDIAPYLPLIQSCLRFFDEHYQYLALQRGAKRLDADGHLVLYPGSGGETFKGAYNSTSTIAALRTVTESLMAYITKEDSSATEKDAHAIEKEDSVLLAYLSSLSARLPAITIRDGMIAPALHYERVQNVETTQLYPVFPWRTYGVGRPHLDIARRTYQRDSLALQFRSHVGWKQDVIWAACLGMTDEAARLLALKLHDGPHRFPAFWGPGYDWTPDHNWGGSAMIGLQEMLLQEVGDTLLLFPAWPRQWDVRFKLHASRGTTVEAELRGGRVVSVNISPTRPYRPYLLFPQE